MEVMLSIYLRHADTKDNNTMPAERTSDEWSYLEKQVAEWLRVYKSSL